MSSNFLIADFKTGLQKNVDPWLLPSDAFPTLQNSFLYRGVVRKKGGSDLLGRLVFGANPGVAVPIDGSVVGLALYQTPSINQEQLIAFGIQSTLGATPVVSNFYNVATGLFDPLDTTLAVNRWAGTTSDLFWHTNFRDLIFVVNNLSTNPIRTHTSVYPANWVNFVPVINNAADELRNCRIILPYKNRLVCLSTFEGPALGPFVEFPQRARWSSAIDPLAVATDWNEDVSGRGGFLDAPTNERIISAGFIKDTLIVYFERSTWQLSWRRNSQDPFEWNRIDAEFGSESTFSISLFDEGAVGVGYNGIFQSGPLGTQRIDLKIPDEAFRFRNSPGAVQQIYAIRDFYAQAIYIAFANLNTPQVDPISNNSILYFNYDEKSWAIFEGSYTTFGYYNEATDPASPTWASLSVNPDDFWSNLNILWGSSPLQQNFPIVVAGNQKGYVHKIFWGDPFPTSIREAVMFETAAITSANPAVVTVVNHNLQTNQLVRFSNFVGVPAGWVTALTDVIFQVERLTANTFSLRVVTLLADPDGDWVDFDASAIVAWAGTADISQVMNFAIETKRLNPAIQDGSQIRLMYNDLYVATNGLNTAAEMNMELEIDNNPARVLSLNVSLFNANQDKIWKRVFLESIGTFFTLYFQLNPRQISDIDILDQLINIHAIDLNTRPVGGRLTQ